MSEENKTIKIDGKEYEWEQLSDEAKSVINSMAYTDRELSRLKNDMSVLRAARVQYETMLKKAIES